MSETTQASGRSAWVTPLAALAVVFLAAVALRVLHLGDQPLWYDEAFSLWFAQQSYSHLWTVYPTYEAHSPMYAILLRAWTVFGESEAALRSMSVVFSLSSVVLLWLTGREIARERTGRDAIPLLAALLLAVAPIQIHYAQEARPYALLCFSVGLMLLGGARLALRPELGARPLWKAPLTWLSITVGLALTLWLQPLGIFIAFCFGLFLLVCWALDQKFNWTFFFNVAAACTAALLLYAPQVLNTLKAAQGWSEGSWLKAPTRWELIDYLQELYSVYVESVPDLIGQAGLAFGVLAALAGAGILWFSGRRSIAALLAGMAFGPAILILIVTYAAVPSFTPRAVSSSQLPFYLLIAVSIFALPTRILKTAVSVALVAVLTSVTFATEIGRAREPWPVAARIIAEQGRPGDLVLAMPNGVKIALEHYFTPPPGVPAAVAIPAPYPATGFDAPYPSGVPGVPGMTDAIVAQAAALADRYPGKVFLVKRNAALFDPDDRLEKALSVSRERLSEQRFRAIRLVIYGERRAQGSGDPAP